MLSSGTVGAALEGSISGCKAIAVSFPFFQGWDNWTDADVDSAVQVASPNQCLAIITLPKPVKRPSQASWIKHNTVLTSP